MDATQAILMLEKIVTIILLIILVIKTNTIINEVKSHTQMDDSQHKNLQTQLSAVSRKVEDAAKDIAVMKERRQ